MNLRCALQRESFLFHPQRRREVKKFLFVLVTVLVLSTLVLSACAKATPVPTEAPVVTAAPTEAPTPEPTEVPVGTADNPLVMVFVPSATTDELVAGGEAVAAKLSELTGYTITSSVPTSYAAAVEAMGSGNAQIGWLPPLAYLLAKEKGFADVALITLRSGSNHYGVQFSTHVDMLKSDENPDGFTAYFDPATNANTGTAEEALAQFNNKKPCWTDPLSASGYVIPSGMVKANVEKLKSAAFVVGHPTVITALYAGVNKSSVPYVGMICDFGATYIDARTSKGLAEDVMEKVVVVYRTDPIIPNDNVSFAPTLSDEVKAKLVQGLLDLAGTEEGAALLKGMGYSIEGLEVQDDTFYDEFRVYLQASGLDITTLVK